MLMRAKPLRQQLITFKYFGSISGKHQMNFEAEHGSGSSSHSAVIRLPGPNRDETICPSGHRRPTQELQFASLITAHAQTREIIALDP
jgi:hypothetical protein